MPGDLIDIGKTSDAALAGIMRRQMGADVISGQRVPVMQQLIVEALARILERPAGKLIDGEMRKDHGLAIVKE
jgi:hypothetical protein